MMRWLRRLLWIGAFVGGGYSGYRAWARRQVQSSDSAPPTWPSLPLVGTGDEVTNALPRWVAPIEGQCPAGYPVKANANSGIYHVPSGRFYVRTVPERCYATVEDAVADGYRAAKA